jgi:hypothetical protein
MWNRLLPLLGTGLLALASVAHADAPSLPVSIKDQGFVPQEISVPAGTKVLLVISNLDDLPAEFESYDLSREVVVPAHGQVKIYIGPLDPGRFRFFNDFHPSSEGWVVVGSATK